MQTTSNLGHLNKPSIQALIHGLNRHYYSIAINYRQVWEGRGERGEGGEGREERGQEERKNQGGSLKQRPREGGREGGVMMEVASVPSLVH